MKPTDFYEKGHKGRLAHMICTQNAHDYIDSFDR